MIKANLGGLCPARAWSWAATRDRHEADQLLFRCRWSLKLGTAEVIGVISLTLRAATPAHDALWVVSPAPLA